MVPDVIDNSPPLMFMTPVLLLFAVLMSPMKNGLLPSTVTVPAERLRVPTPPPLVLPTKTLTLAMARLPPLMFNVAVCPVSATPKYDPPVALPVAFQFTTVGPCGALATLLPKIVLPVVLKMPLMLTVPPLA